MTVGDRRRAASPIGALRRTAIRRDALRCTPDRFARRSRSSDDSTTSATGLHRARSSASPIAPRGPCPPARGPIASPPRFAAHRAPRRPRLSAHRAAPNRRRPPRPRRVQIGRHGPTPARTATQHQRSAGADHGAKHRRGQQVVLLVTLSPQSSAVGLAVARAIRSRSHRRRHESLSLSRTRRLLQIAPRPRSRRSRLGHEASLRQPAHPAASMPSTRTRPPPPAAPLA